ncbi:hypothetical protein D5043_01810 [Verminephrobacter eiseniae]|nr:hypothetical protein [Verminephrobacter eiseniae]MCW5303399.1 hypothetical protein [Verminephrobacter eiseniae]
MSRHRSPVGLRWPSKRSAALHRLPIRSVWAARSLRHLIRDATRRVDNRLPGSRPRMRWKPIPMATSCSTTPSWTRTMRTRLVWYACKSADQQRR